MEIDLFGSRWYDKGARLPTVNQSVSVGSSSLTEDRTDSQHTSDESPSETKERDEGVFFQETDERVSNSYATSLENRLRKDAQAEESHYRQRKLRKRLEIAKESLQELLDKHEKCFARDPDVPPPHVPKRLARHIIELKEGAELGRSPGMRRRSKEDDEFISSVVKKLLEYGLIRRSNAQHACQVHIAKTPGREPRFCIDYRPVNELTKEDPFPLPRMDELLYGMNGATVFSTLDAQKGFWQIRMGKGREYSAFRTAEGVFEWVVMPFGLMNAPATFQRFMNEAFVDLSFVHVYIDDITVFSSTLEQHLSHLEKVFHRVEEYGITLKKGKCEFMKDSVKLLGYYVSAQGITQDPLKLEAIQNFEQPRNVRELKRFLGMIQFFRMFSSSTARLLTPLYELCKKKVKWRWQEAEIKAFNEVKSELIKKRTLAYPDLTKKFFVSVDASDYAMGANLYQFKHAEDGTLDLQEVLAYSDEWTKEELDSFHEEQAVPHIVESFSKKWNKHEVNYTTSEKECLAIVNALERWKHYLAPKEFVVWSDHRALSALKSTEKPRLKRWKLRLTPFTFDLKWKAGRTMKDVDTLSRDARYKTLFVDNIRGYGIESMRAIPEDFVRIHEPLSADQATAEIESEISCNLVEDSLAARLDLLPLEVGDEIKSMLCYPTEESEQADEKEKAQGLRIDTEIQESLLKHSSSFSESQRKDPSVRKIVAKLKDSGPYSGFEVRDDEVLLKSGRVYIPSHEVPLIMWMMHDHPLSGHVGQTKLLERLRARYYWPKMSQTVRKYLAKCSCTRSKAKKGTKVGRTVTFSHYGPLDCLQLDIVGPFPLSNRRNQYWLTLIDRYTRTVELVPIPNRQANTVARAIYKEWITRYGCPLVILGDNEFRSQIMKELSSLVGASQLHSAPYKPSTNGLCERVHAFASQIMQNSNGGKIKDWDELLPAVRFAIMTSRLDGLGFSPYQLLYGRQPRLPVDYLIPVDTNVPKNVREYYNQLAESITEIREMFDYTQSKVDARMRYKRDRSQRRRPADFAVGDLVYHTRDYYNQDPLQRGLAKLLGKFAGPNPIVRKIGPNTYEVKIGETTKVFNAEHLAPYRGEDPPIYRTKPEENHSEDERLDDGPVEEPENPGGSTVDRPRRSRKRARSPTHPEGSKGSKKPRGPSASEGPPTSIASSSSKTRSRSSHVDSHRGKQRRDEPTEADTVREDVNGVIGQFVLAYDKAMQAQKKTSLFLGKITEIGEDGTETVHVFKGRTIRKRLQLLPYWYREISNKNRDYDTKITDKSLTSEWRPWLINLSEDYEVVDRSTERESGEAPPERMVQKYRQVWEGVIFEKDLALSRVDVQNDLDVQEARNSDPVKRGKPLLQNRRTGRRGKSTRPKAGTTSTRRRVRFDVDK